MKKKHNRAFVLMETIVVITVLCIILIVLFAAYSKILVDVEARSYHDNTEYIYKSQVIRKFLESRLDIVNFMGNKYVSTYCSNQLPGYKQCSDATVEGNKVFSHMKVQGIYFISWDDKANSKGRYIELEPTTQKYISSIDVPVEKEMYRIMIVMYESENGNIEYGNEGLTEPKYEYASLRFGSRG